MKNKSKGTRLIIGVLVLALLCASGYQIKAVFSQDAETPEFGGQKAPFVPVPEQDREAPPPPSNATIVRDLPKNLFVRDNDTDREPLAITNKTELLEVLPANATKAIEYVDKSLKNSTGQGLLPPAVLNNLNASVQAGNMSSLNQGQNTSTILDILNKENLTQKILPIISPTNKSATSSDLEEMVEPQPAGAAANATVPEEQAANETAPVSGSETKNASELNETPSEQIPSAEQSQPLTNKSEELPPLIKNPGKNENEETINKLVNKTQEGELPPVNVTVNKLVNKTQEGELPPVNLTINKSLNEPEENPPVSQSDNSEENPPVSQSDNSEENPPSDNTGDKSDNVNNDNK